MASHFRTFAQTDGARVVPVTVTIDRRLGLVHVRPFRRRRTYTLPLSAVASLVVLRVVQSELREQHRLAKRRKTRR